MDVHSKEIRSYNYWNVMPFQVMDDQPTTCPICGARTEIISNFLHSNLQALVIRCLNQTCKHVFLEVEN